MWSVGANFHARGMDPSLLTAEYVLGQPDASSFFTRHNPEQHELIALKGMLTIMLAPHPHPHPHPHILLLQLSSWYL